MEIKNILKSNYQINYCEKRNVNKFEVIETKKIPKGISLTNEFVVEIKTNHYYCESINEAESLISLLDKGVNVNIEQ